MASHTSHHSKSINVRLLGTGDFSDATNSRQIGSLDYLHGPDGVFFFFFFFKGGRNERREEL